MNLKLGLLTDWSVDKCATKSKRGEIFMNDFYTNKVFQGKEKSNFKYLIWFFFARFNCHREMVSVEVYQLLLWYNGLVRIVNIKQA